MKIEIEHVEGAEAAGFDAVSTSSMLPINRGRLISADIHTGQVVYQDTPETQRTLSLGKHEVAIVPKSTYGR